MGVYDSRVVGGVELKPGMINGDYIDLTLIGDGIYVQDGALYVPVKLWERMQAALYEPESKIKEHFLAMDKPRLRMQAGHWVVYRAGVDHIDAAAMRWVAAREGYDQ